MSKIRDHLYVYVQYPLKNGQTFMSIVQRKGDLLETIKVNNTPIYMP